MEDVWVGIDAHFRRRSRVELLQNLLRLVLEHLHRVATRAARSAVLHRRNQDQPVRHARNVTVLDWHLSRVWSWWFGLYIQQDLYFEFTGTSTSRNLRSRILIYVVTPSSTGRR